MLELRAVNNLQRHCQIQTAHQNTAEPRDLPKEPKKGKGQPKTNPGEQKAKNSAAAKTAQQHPTNPVKTQKQKSAKHKNLGVTALSTIKYNKYPMQISHCNASFDKSFSI